MQIFLMKTKKFDENLPDSGTFNRLFIAATTRKIFLSIGVIFSEKLIALIPEA